MNEKFYLLEEKRQMEIINAGFEVFGKYDYKKASTEMIAQRAGISKGLLFFYFRNKLEFYKFLYHYATKIISTEVENMPKEHTPDFFEGIEIIIRQKCIVLEATPHIFSFMISVMNTPDESVRNAISDIQNDDFTVISKEWMAQIDLTKFKKGVDPKEILEMLGLLLEGYLQQQLKNKQPVILNDIMTKYKIWSKILKEASYNV